MSFSLKQLCQIVATSVGLAVVGTALAQQPENIEAYPARPITTIVPYAAGGGYDVIARVVAKELSNELGQNVLVDNRPGVSGITGTEAASRALPDGYTILIGGGTMAINPSLYKNLSYHPVNSFEPLSTIGGSALVLVVPKDSPANTVQELIQYAKSKPEGLNFASAGSGTPIHLAGELFNRDVGVSMTHVPYKGTAPALTDLVAGRVDLLFDVPSSSKKFIEAGQIKALGVTGAQRSSILPDVPTLQQSGVEELKNFEVSSWFAYFAPAGTPAAIVAKLNAALRKAVDSPAVQQAFANMGLEPFSSTPDELRARIGADMVKWGAIIEAANVTVN